MYLLIVSALLLCLSIYFIAKANCKAYIETHIPKNDIEDAAITSKKVELNGWLYEAQFNKKIFGGWSMYSDLVLELEPIE